jgi:MSHA biogenesis protein MshL
MKHLLSLVFGLLLAAAPVLLPAADGAPRAAEPRFDIAVVNAPARVFFMGLVRDTPYNIVVSPDVTGEITLDLKQVTVPEVLEMARALYGYDFSKLPAGYLVLPAALQTRLFYVNYIDLERSGSSRTRVTSGQLTQAGRSSSGTSGESGQSGMTGQPGSGQAGGGMGSSTPSSTTGSTIDTRYKVNFWGELEASLQQMMPKDGNHNVVVNAQSGIVAVRAMPRELNEVAKFLAQIQNSSSRQVIIEAKIIEVQLNNDYQAGVNWTALLKHGNSTTTIGQQSPADFASNLLAPSGTPITVGPGNPVNGLANTALGGAFTLALDFKDFGAYVNLLQIQGNTRVLSSPRVATLNNQKAVIKSGSDQFFVTNVASNTVTGTAAATSNNVELTPFFSGVALDVTPQIDDDGYVILHIHPTVSQVTSQTTVLTVNGVSDSLPLALSQIRESDSVVKARSGQVIVIGGLMQTQTAKTDYQTPGLGSIPLLGNLFKSKQTTSVKTELVILLRPIVVGAQDAAWSPLVDSSIADARKLDPHVNGEMSGKP